MTVRVGRPAPGHAGSLHLSQGRAVPGHQCPAVHKEGTTQCTLRGPGALRLLVANAAFQPAPAETPARHQAWDPEPRVAEARGVLPGPRGQPLGRAGPRLWPGAFGVDRRAPWGSGSGHLVMLARW